MTDVITYPTAVHDDTQSGTIRSTSSPIAATKLPGHDHPVFLTVNSDGSVWAYFDDRDVETYGEVARQLIKADGQALWGGCGHDSCHQRTSCVYL